MDFGRMATAMVTPFDAHGRIDEYATKALIHHLIETGTTALVVSGTTGESPTLSHEEKLTLFDIALKAADGRVPVVAGTGSNDTRSTAQLTREAAAVGVHAIMLVSPYYNRPSQDGLYTHFSEVASAVNLPVMLYNIPSRCGVNITPETLLRLAKIENIVAVKEASGDLSQILRIAASKPDDFALYSGDDKFTLPMLALGATGVVSVASHVVGREMTMMMDAFWNGRHREASDLAARLLPLFEVLFEEPNPAPVKAALDLLGVASPSMRLPMIRPSAPLVQRLNELLATFGYLTTA